MTGVDAAEVMRGLKGFQQDAVEHVIDRFYGRGRHDGSGRFLVADETGLGKSVIARGIIARAIEELEHDDSVDRIDIVYICSNADLASQNLKRLNVTGDEQVALPTRLTLLARESGKLSAPAETGGGKKINLVSFTPGTSFKEGGWRSGNAAERALLCVFAEQRLGVDEDQASLWLFQGAAYKPGSFTWRVNETRAALKKNGGADQNIVEKFRELVDEDDLWERFLDLREQVHALNGPPPRRERLAHDISDLIAKFRRRLARAGVKAIEPDLIILDEFQRFRPLLDPTTPAGELADDLFREGDAKVLLLSATPFKAFTGETEVGDDHQQDFLTLIDFLADDQTRVAGVKEALDAHRLAMITEGDAAASALQVRDALLPVMSRSERPPLARNQDMVVDRPLDGGVPSASEIADWSALSRLGEHLGARMDLEQWKSIPYFASFMDTYKSGSRVREALDSGDGVVSQLLTATRGLTRERVDTQTDIDLGNGMLRALASETVDQGWWKLLWMPPSMPYLEPGPVYSSVGDMTKHVVFSAWNGVPTAVAGLLSHDAARRAQAGSTRSSDSTSGRLAWGLKDGVPSQMSTLALFWPHPALAEQWDPVRAAREAGGRVDPASFTSSSESEDESREPSQAFFATPGAVPEGIDPLSVPRFANVPSPRFAAYVSAAAEAMTSAPTSHRDLSGLGAHSPGSVAYRAMRSAASADATPAGVWRAAWVLSLGLRALFARPETAALLDTVGSDRPHFWSVVLDYCADGNLQAVIDEYVHLLRSERAGRLLDDDGLWAIASEVASAVRTNAATLLGHEATPERAPISFATRFAVRYGGAGTDADEKAAARQKEVRAAFNSPFAPFILASTSIGQEGIDFHWWSHAVVHWNLPSNPVDFEQREGRVHRFIGHAVRKNVAARHWDDVLASSDAPWDAAFAAAVDASQTAELGQFAPWWVYDGDARIHRRIASFTLSRDHEKYERLLDALTLYRLTLGQPRQEDMIRLMKQSGVERDLEAGAIDLRPPKRT